MNSKQKRLAIGILATTVLCAFLAAGWVAMHGREETAPLLPSSPSTEPAVAKRTPSRAELLAESNARARNLANEPYRDPFGNNSLPKLLRGTNVPLDESELPQTEVSKPVALLPLEGAEPFPMPEEGDK